jgi:ABC-2 type transport system ATP-binding protein
LYDAIVNSPPNIDSPGPTGGLLIATDVRKSYGGFRAVNGVSLEIPHGSLYGLLGPNGAGKTTLISMLTGLMAADSGTVKLGGITVHPRAVDVRRSIGLAPQELAIYPDLTARENARFFARLYGLDGPELERRIDEALGAVQLLDRADEPTRGFSGGMKRRLNLAIAVIHEPKVLFLDEPTAGVDPQSRQAILTEVRRLNANGMTVVYTSHYMDEVQAVCRDVGIMDAGRLLRSGSLAELLAIDASRLRFPSVGSTAEWGGLPGVSMVEVEGGMTELLVPDPAAALPRVVEILKRYRADVARLELRPPTLERVFLMLTGHALRD